MERTRTTRALAESALVDLVRTLGEHAGDIVVIGGLNPDHLVAGVEGSAGIC